MTLYIDALYMKSQQATLLSLKCITSLMIFWEVYSPSVGNTHHTQLFSLNYYCSHHFENYHKFLKNTAELTYNNWKLESLKKKLVQILQCTNVHNCTSRKGIHNISLNLDISP
uniref:Uncharacterized protein n=1 Tax=Micrurus lemniscatus lemniscatus TaxID=129467 RepID=A0A2D4I6A7_MICLE